MEVHIRLCRGLEFRVKLPCKESCVNTNQKQKCKLQFYDGYSGLRI